MKNWGKKGKKWFEQEIAYQIYEDGTFLQFSMNYHRVAVQLLTWAIQLAKLNNINKEWKEAEKLYKKAITIDKENTSAIHGLGITYLRRERHEEALECFLDVVEILYYFPYAHYHIGETLFKMGNYEAAAQAMEVSLTMAPKNLKARKWLVDIYKNHLKTLTRKFSILHSPFSIKLVHG